MYLETNMHEMRLAQEKQHRLLSSCFHYLATIQV